MNPNVKCGVRFVGRLVLAETVSEEVLGLGVSSVEPNEAYIGRHNLNLLTVLTGKTNPQNI